jgi:hypothetical protein
MHDLAKLTEKQSADLAMHCHRPTAPVARGMYITYLGNGFNNIFFLIFIFVENVVTVISPDKNIVLIIASKGHASLAIFLGEDANRFKELATY